VRGEGCAAAPASSPPPKPSPVPATLLEGPLLPVSPRAPQPSPPQSPAPSLGASPARVPTLGGADARASAPRGSAAAPGAPAVPAVGAAGAAASRAAAAGTARLTGASRPPCAARTVKRPGASPASSAADSGSAPRRRARSWRSRCSSRLRRREGAGGASGGGPWPGRSSSLPSPACARSAAINGCLRALSLAGQSSGRAPGPPNSRAPSCHLPAPGLNLSHTRPTRLWSMNTVWAAHGTGQARGNLPAELHGHAAGSTETCLCSARAHADLATHQVQALEHTEEGGLACTAPATTPTSPGERAGCGGSGGSGASQLPKLPTESRRVSRAPTTCTPPCRSATAGGVVMLCTACPQSAQVRAAPAAMHRCCKSPRSA